jgi:hypothetical protein
VYLRDRDGPVERDDRGRCDGRELVVQGQDLAPVGVCGSGRVGVYGGDRRLDLVRPGAVAAQARPYDVVPLDDELPLPLRPVLVGEEYEVPARSGTGGAARLGEQQQREQPERLGLAGGRAARRAQAPGTGYVRP